MDEDKKLRIINSAMEEFSKNKFNKASTNTIVKNANISKGLLYHYFDSKKKLYGYLEKFVIKTLMEEIKENLDWNQQDIFKRIEEIAMIKFEIGQRYPYIFDFSITIFENKSLEEISQISEDFSLEFYSQIYTYNIDYGLFKEEVDIPKAINIIRWTLEKYSEEIRARIIKLNTSVDYKSMEKEVYEYTKMLKKCFYK